MTSRARDLILAFLDSHNGEADHTQLCEALQLDPRKISHALSHACTDGILEREFPNKHDAKYRRTDGGVNPAKRAPKKAKWHGEKAGPVYHREYSGWGGFQRMAGIVNRGRG